MYVAYVSKRQYTSGDHSDALPLSTYIIREFFEKV
jgi:hypothetical protein